jgi:SLAP domain-containing protein
MLGGCGGSESSGADASTSAASDQPVQVSNFRLVESESGERQVMGTLRNTTAKTIGGAQIKVALYDADNVRIETMTVTVDEIPASDSIPFKKSLTTEAVVQGARVQSVLVM